MANKVVSSIASAAKSSKKSKDDAKVSFSASGRDAWRKETGISHKSFDFSDVGLYGGSSSEGKYNPYDFRKFHQTNIFISNPNVGKFSKGEGFEHAYSKAVITSNLPETFSYSLNSQWENPLNFGSGLFNLGAQIFANAGKNGEKVPSGVSRATSFKIWKGTEPMKVVIDIPVIDDNGDSSKTNLVEALEVISSLVLPRYSSDSWGFYNPPPSPLQLKYTFDKAQDGWKTLNNSQQARIMVQLGGILLLDHCVIEKVDVTYPNTKAQIRHTYRDVGKGLDYGNTKQDFLHPLLANVKIVVSTIEALTYDTYYKMIWGKEQSSGELQLDLSFLKNLRKAAYGFMAGDDLSKVIKDLQGENNSKPTNDGWNSTNEVLEPKKPDIDWNKE